MTKPRDKYNSANLVLFTPNTLTPKLISIIVLASLELRGCCPFNTWDLFLPRIRILLVYSPYLVRDTFDERLREEEFMIGRQAKRCHYMKAKRPKCNFLNNFVGY
jgi:hypothetical protein